MNGQFSTLDEFWPFYLSQHLNRTNRALHFGGTTAALVLIALAAALRAPRLLIAAPFAGYGFAWVGHYFFEKNSPATFQYPLLSFRADFRMYALIWTSELDAELLLRMKDIRRYLAD
ncbi:MAG: DUF962 domain-containing protein [Elusimicrobia bacterium]|nr:DUF962 domain-containing protein [Elusimicrobiota bacterium]